MEKIGSLYARVNTEEELHKFFMIFIETDLLKNKDKTSREIDLLEMIQEFIETFCYQEDKN